MKSASVNSAQTLTQVAEQAMVVKGPVYESSELQLKWKFFPSGKWESQGFSILTVTTLTIRRQRISQTMAR
jgi:hypothetical protein